MAPGFDRFVGVDWSGAARPAAQRVYVAEVRARGRQIGLSRVVRADGRAAVEQWLAGGRLERAPGWASWRRARRIRPGERVLVGLDFAFGFPVAFDHPERGGAWRWEDLADLAADLDSPRGARAEIAARGDLPQFRLDRGSAVEGALRVTDTVLSPRPESVFRLFGQRQVGLGSIAGIAMLARLRSGDHFAAWPIDSGARLGGAAIVAAEAWPRRWLDRGLGKEDPARRVAQAEAWQQRDGVTIADSALLAIAGSADALDSAAIAIGLAREHRSGPPERRPHPDAEREGWILGAEPSIPAGRARPRGEAG